MQRLFSNCPVIRMVNRMKVLIVDDIEDSVKGIIDYCEEKIGNANYQILMKHIKMYWFLTQIS